MTNESEVKCGKFTDHKWHDEVERERPRREERGKDSEMELPVHEGSDEASSTKGSFGRGYPRPAVREIGLPPRSHHDHVWEVAFEKWKHELERSPSFSGGRPAWWPDRSDARIERKPIHGGASYRGAGDSPANPPV